MTYASQQLAKWAKPTTKSRAARAWAEANDMPYVEVECPPHSWIRDGGSGAVCTHCGREITEVEKYAPSDVTIDDQERGM